MFADYSEKMADQSSDSLVSSLYAGFFKRIFDVAFCIVILPLIVPVLVVLYIATRRDGGPAFFGHTRVGKDGKKFKCWKVRSMVVDAEARLKEHLDQNPEAAAEWARDFKLENDPRITRFGDFLRKSSLDELPQFFNVLRGDMSVVGPRPVTEVELAKYGSAKQVYLACKPGITGLWQVSGRNDVEYAERVQMDVDYRARMGVLLDTTIIAKTAFAVVGRTGR